MSSLLSYDSLRNIRDLGGMSGADGRKIRRGKLIRCGNLAEPSSGDTRRLGELVDTIVDFRTEAERAEKPDIPVPGAANCHIPVVDSLTEGISRERGSDMAVIARLGESPEEAKAYMCGLYTGFVTGKYARSQYERFVRILLEEHERAVLWHCTAGKDRAGIAAVIVEELLGTPRDAIVADYLKTNEYLAEDIASLTEMIKRRMGVQGGERGERAARALRYLFGAEEDYIGAFYRKAEEWYGGVDGFLRDGLHITETETEKLRGMYLE